MPVQTFEFENDPNIKKLQEDKAFIRIDEGKTFCDLVNYVMHMDTQYRDVLKELADTKIKLAAMQQQNVHKAGLTERAQQELTSAKEKLDTVKTKVQDTARHTVESIKAHGVVSLNKMVDLAHIRPLMRGMERNLGNAVQALEKDITQTEAIDNELHAASQHMKNAGRALVGKDTAPPTDRAENKGLLHPIRTIFRDIKQRLFGMRESTLYTLDKLNALEKNAENIRVQRSRSAQEQEAVEQSPTEQPAAEAAQEQDALVIASQKLQQFIQQQNGVVVLSSKLILSKCMMDGVEYIEIQGQNLQRLQDYGIQPVEQNYHQHYILPSGIDGAKKLQQLIRDNTFEQILSQEECQQLQSSSPVEQNADIEAGSNDMPEICELE